ncbi:MAG: hypothetical protein U0Y10_13960 [Spirosomataceae bacterium]
MKALSTEEMAVVEGGVSCSLALAYFQLMLATRVPYFIMVGFQLVINSCGNFSDGIDG